MTRRPGRMVGWNRPSGGNGELARGASAAAAKGAALIGLAVIVGVFLLQRVDTSNAGSSPSTTPVHAARTTTTTARKSTSSTPATTSTTQPSTPVKTPDQLKVLVLNGGAATARRPTCVPLVANRSVYTNQPQASTWSGHKQTGKSILCRAGLAREAVALAQQTALQGAKVQTLPHAGAAVERRRRLRHRRRRLTRAVTRSGRSVRRGAVVRATGPLRRRSRSRPSRARPRRPRDRPTH